jgi:hypothetical protein
MSEYSDEAMGAMRRRVEEALFAWGDVRPKKVFGHPAYLHGGKMFAFMTADGVGIGNLPEEDTAALLARDDVSPFVYNGMPMKQWIVLPLVDDADLAAAMPWIQLAYEGATRR